VRRVRNVLLLNLFSKMIRLFYALLESLVYPLILVMIMWLVFVGNINYGWNLERFGLHPHEIKGLLGILFMPLLHENLEHLFSNSIPILVAGGFLFYYFNRWTWLIISTIYIGSGTILWFIGETGTNHIGASGLVYGLVFFLLVSGLIRGQRQLAAVALLMVFLYGSLVWGLFPEYARLVEKNISWEGHLGGAIVGILMAILLIKKGPVNNSENLHDDEDDDENPYWLDDQSEDVEKSEPESKTENDPIINYRYVPKNANSWEQND
jgi:membrane associated rhomboid family serine protease